ncbi:MAG: hypothetical protein LBC67_00280 [Spirochaetales bacterium]|jgi:uncharacterized membrane protein YcgQ (UPF0703/DUF1980 family)|nr:hypothetical protein [Spirochaetales bacterium]
MKKKIVCLLVAAAGISACGFGGGRGELNGAGTRSVDTGSRQKEAGLPRTEGSAQEEVAASVPIFEIKEKMFITQINDIYLNAEDYVGKTLKYEGIFDSFKSPETGIVYRWVTRYGPGCCGTDSNAGFEVIWPEEIPREAPARPRPATRREYPEKNAWVEVTGRLSSYEEEGCQYLRVELASLRVMPVRGAEFVSQ